MSSDCTGVVSDTGVCKVIGTCVITDAGACQVTSSRVVTDVIPMYVT